jgi:Ca-activated chloride channel homolog
MQHFSDKAMMRAGKQSKRQMWFVAALLALSLCLAHAQSSLEDIHVTPRGQPANPNTAGWLRKTAGGLIRTSVELVLVPVTVTDGANRIVTGLGRENFHLFEDKHPQPIKELWEEDGPLSIGILLDVSGSMNDKFDRARDAVRALLEDSNPQDEFFLVTFANQPTLLRDFTQNTDEIQGSLLFAAPKGRTSLLDAVVLAVNNMKRARHRRRALVIISDGGDNRSRYTEKDVKALIKEADVLVYSIAVCDREVRTEEERLGPELLAEISGVTGASAYALDNPNNLPRIAEHIAAELRHQYILGYSPSNSRHDGKWRKIKVSLALPRGIPELHVQARTGYYSRAQ